MYESKGLWLAIPLALLCGAVAVLLTSCDLSLSQPTPVPGAPTDTPVPSQPTAAPTEVTPPAPAIITLTIWTTEAFSPTQAITSGQVLAQQAAEFEATHPDARLEFVLKKPYGKGGILDYLLTTKAVVPDLLPDLVFIDVSELEAAVRAELVQPLDSLIPGDLAGDLYPFAADACTFEGRLYGLQFQGDLDYLVYNTGKVTVPPSSWPGVLSNPGPYLLPAGGQAGLVNDAFLIQYLAVRPWPVAGDPDAPFLDQDSLVAVLQFYQDGISRGIIPGNIVQYHTTDDCWSTYLEGEAAMSQVGGHRYLEEQDRAENSALAPIPSINGPAPAIGRGWALALVTPDPARQSAAVDLMGLFMAPETNAAWNLAANFLPTRQAALASWDTEDRYSPFIDQQLQAAQARPSIPNYTRVAAALQKAVEDVISEAATPEEAAAEVIESVQ
jgi:ABC-type glycerol-3-phosphate transport system substrate-binding protein